MDSTFQRHLHAFTNIGSIEFDDCEPLPDDELDIPPELVIGEEEDLFVASLHDVQWTDLGMQSFLATLPATTKPQLSQ
jgi:hypothetical protein